MTTDPESFDPPAIDEAVVLYDIKELRAYVARTIHNYYHLGDDDNG